MPPHNQNSPRAAGYEILGALKSGTREAHDSIEKAVDFMRPDVDSAIYTRRLERFLGFYRPFERELLRHQNLFTTAGVDLSRRSKTEWLKSDLLGLGLNAGSIEALPDCDRVPEYSGLAECLGALYVVEGSTLGGQIICRHLKSVLPQSLQTSLSFFASYGARTGAMWKEFCEILRENLTDGAEGEHAVRAARLTFASLESWLSGY